MGRTGTPDLPLTDGTSPPVARLSSSTPFRSVPASHARVSCQRPALAAPADLLHRPGPLPHGLGRRRPLFVWNRPVHLQRERQGKGLSFEGGGCSEPALLRTAVLTISAVHLGGLRTAQTAPTQARRRPEAESPAVRLPHVTCSHVIMPHVTGFTHDRM